MSAIRNVAWNATGMYIFQTNWTIRMGNIFHTLNRKKKKITQWILSMNYFLSLWFQFFVTLCPFSRTIGKHMLHLAQWKNLSRPPTRHIPQPSQWYWFLSSSSKRLHSRHVYLPNRQWQFWHVACTGWRVSHNTHINSVTSFLLTVCVSCSSWQKRQVYTLLQHGVCN